MQELNNFYQEKLYEIPTELCQIMNECGSDKGNGHHNYTTLYYFLWDKIKNGIKNVFEVGIGTTNPEFPHGMGPNGVVGASLFGWKRYFENSNIYSCDIDPNCLFNEDRIKTFYCDQRDSSGIKKMFTVINCKEFDIIIDDGLHVFSANLMFLYNSIEFLKKGGFYLIEDIDIPYLKEASEFVENNKNNFKYIGLMKIPNPKNNIDNNLILIIK